jgi:CheY-specific phosphatase CheX
LDHCDRDSSGERLAEAECREQPLASFLEATIVTFAEMTGTEVAVERVDRALLDQSAADIAVAVQITSASAEMMRFDYSQPVASAIAKRVLADSKEEMNETLVQDCVAEIANVIAGQTKTLLSSTPHQMTYSLPQIVVGESPKSSTGSGSPGPINVRFRSELGHFTLRLTMYRTASPGND